PYGGIDWLGTRPLVNFSPLLFPPAPGGLNVAQTQAAVTTLSFPTPVVFDGAYISGNGTNNKWKLYLGGVNFFTSSGQDAHNFISGGVAFFPSGSSNAVDKVEFVNDAADGSVTDVALGAVQYETPNTVNTGSQSYP